MKGVRVEYMPVIGEIELVVDKGHTCLAVKVDPAVQSIALYHIDGRGFVLLAGDKGSRDSRNFLYLDRLTGILPVPDRMGVIDHRDYGHNLDPREMSGSDIAHSLQRRDSPGWDYRGHRSLAPANRHWDRQGDTRHNWDRSDSSIRGGARHSHPVEHPEDIRDFVRTGSIDCHIEDWLCHRSRSSHWAFDPRTHWGHRGCRV